MARTTWIGGAPVVEQVSTITIASVWAAGDTLTVTINGKAMILTVGTLATTGEVANNLYYAWEGLDLGTGYSVNFKGTEAGEFYEIQASVSGSVVTLTERAINGPDGTTTEGRPFTFASTYVTAGAGTTTDDAVVAATGPHHWTNAANWTGGAVPSSSDLIYFTGDVPCRYGIDQSAVITSCSLSLLGSFEDGELGLPRYRTVTLPDGTDDVFEEYLEQYFKTNTGGETDVWIGQGDGGGPKLVKINTQTSILDVACYKTGTPDVDTDPAVFLRSNNASSTVKVYGGLVAIGFYADELQSGSNNAFTGGAYVYQDGDSEAILVIGAGATVPATVAKGGTVTVVADTGSAAVTASDGATINLRGLTTTSASLRAYGGTINVGANSTGAGVVYLAQGTSGNLPTVNVLGHNSFTITTCKLMTAGATLNIPGYRALVVTNDVVLGRGLTLEDVTINIPAAHPSTTAKIVHEVLP